jgi:hypothetical protein
MSDPRPVSLDEALLMGIVLHEAVSARRRRPWAGSVRAPLLAACMALFAEIGLTMSWVDSYTHAHPAAHYAAHGVMFLGGVLVAFALSSPRLRCRALERRRGAPTA